MSKLASVADVQFSGPLLQVSSFGVLGIGIVDVNTIAVVVGLLFSLAGFFLSLRSYKIQKLANEKQILQADLEIERTEMEILLLKQENPELDLNRKKDAKQRRTPKTSR